ncbi:MAG: Lrp/AsnC family transcriptional regulator [Crenarchaeota archaeon]|nr:Lrp/AsnC family transcriptional regulator [Thermoproteota archaeon]
MRSLIELLMELQYNFPLTERPFHDIALKLDTDPEKIIETVRSLREKGIIRRIGSVLNYRSRNLKAALVALRVSEKYIDNVIEHINNLGGVSHNFLREHDLNIWFVIKRQSMEDIVKIIREICSQYSINEYAILESVKTYRLDVRFDLYRGISRAKILRQEDPPKLEQVSKIPIEALRELMNIDIVERPFRKISEKYLIDEKVLIDEIKKLINLHVLRDFYAVLDQSNIGFRINSMIIIRSSLDNIEKILKLQEPTHIVYRRLVDGTRRDLEGIYLMIHAVCKEVIHEFLKKNLSEYNYIILHSIKNLLPSMPHDIEYSTN